MIANSAKSYYSVDDDTYNEVDDYDDDADDQYYDDYVECYVGHYDDYLNDNYSYI